MQNYSVVEPNVAITPVAQAIPHHMTQQQSHPNSPVVQSPISIPQHGTGTPLVYGTQTAVQAAQPMTPVQQTVFALPGATPHGTFDPTLSVPGGFVTVNSPTMCTPMSSLGYQRTDNTQFPDLLKLETVDASHVNMELFNRGLAEPWNQYQNQIQQQVISLVSLSLSLIPSHHLPFSVPLPFSLVPGPLPVFSLVYAHKYYTRKNEGEGEPGMESHPSVATLTWLSHGRGGHTLHYALMMTY